MIKHWEKPRPQVFNCEIPFVIVHNMAHGLIIPQCALITNYYRVYVQAHTYPRGVLHKRTLDFFKKM